MFFEKRGGIRGCGLPGTVVALGSTDPTVGDVIGGRKTIKFWGHTEFKNRLVNL